MGQIKDFLAVVADDEWTAVRAARALRAQWSEWSGLPAQDQLAATLRVDPDITDEVLITKGSAVSPRPGRRENDHRQLLLADAEPRLVAASLFGRHSRFRVGSV